MLKVDRATGKAVVEGVNRVKKHIRRSQKYPQGGVLRRTCRFSFRMCNTSARRAVPRPVWVLASSTTAAKNGSARSATQVPAQIAPAKKAHSHAAAGKSARSPPRQRRPARNNDSVVKHANNERWPRKKKNLKRRPAARRRLPVCKRCTKRDRSAAQGEAKSRESALRCRGSTRSSSAWALAAPPRIRSTSTTPLRPWPKSPAKSRFAASRSKSIASFRLREGLDIGCKVTLRRARMYEFLDRLISLALPRVRDFRGLNPDAFDGHGNYSLGLNEQLVFPGNQSR